MITARINHYKKDRQYGLLFSVPVGEFFQILITPNPEKPDEKYPHGLYRKIAFQTKYASFNCVDLWTSEVHELDEYSYVIRLLPKNTFEFEEDRFDRRIKKT